MGLHYNVMKDSKGKFVRRSFGVADRFGMDYIDVEWTSDEEFPEDHELRPMTHPPEIKYGVVPVGVRKVIHDTITVPPTTPDSVIMVRLEEMKVALAERLGMKP